MTNKDQDEFYMRMALEEARRASLEDEVPVGAVVVQTAAADGMSLEAPLVISKGRNNRESEPNPLGHGELLAIQTASQNLGRWRLSGCTLYVTLEPCLMCAGAVILSRLDRVVYGAVDPKAGAVQSLYQVLADPRLNHRPRVDGGVLESECSILLKDFFALKRGKKTTP